jgi:hypothetical protein
LLLFFKKAGLPAARHEMLRVFVVASLACHPRQNVFHCRNDRVGRKPLNAILPNAPELSDRDLDMLQELAELGMQLARLAVQQAQQDEAAEPPRPRRADPRIIFLRLSNTIRETITLKTRLAAGILPPPPRPPREPKTQPQPQPQPTEASPEPQDARRPLILRYFREGIDLTRQKSKIATSQQIVENHIDAELAKDPEARLPGRDILLKICKSLDLPFYANRMHSDLLRRPKSPTPHNSAKQAESRTGSSFLKKR